MTIDDTRLPDTSPGRTRLLLAFATPLLVVILLYVCNVPYGRPDHQVYPWSSLFFPRFLAALVPIAAAVPACVVLLRSRLIAEVSYRAALAATLALAAFLGVWTFFAPPNAIAQHYFNLLSPSQDGAFLYEARHIESLRDYLEDFPAILERSPEELKGTRLLGNPPGVTIIAYGVFRALDDHPVLAQVINELHGSDLSPASEADRPFAQAMCVAWIFTLMWVVSAGFLFAAAAVWLPPLVAAVVALFCFFNPSAVLFSPGKDPAQLLTIAILVWGWLASFKGARIVPAVLAGAALAVGLAWGLIHAWIAIIVAVATLWAVRRDRPGLVSWLVRTAVPAAAGALVVCIATWLLWRWNLPATVLAVGRSYQRVLEYLGEIPWQWDLAKVPMFGLLAGGGFWLLVAWPRQARLTDKPAGVGRAAVVATLAIMAYSLLYTRLETPRLWLAFVPTLALGFALTVPSLRRPSPAGIRALLIAAVLQVITTSLMWCFFDARESEMRLLTGRLFE